MIYVLSRNLSDDWHWSSYTITHIFSVPDGIDVDSLYKDRIFDLAYKNNAVINPHYYNLMNHENHHPDLSESEYNNLLSKWNELLKNNSKLSFLYEIGEELEYKSIIDNTIWD